MTWDQPTIDRVTTLWLGGKSASEIAAIIPGASRNAVIGKVQRMGLKRSESAIRSTQAAQRGVTTPRRMDGGRKVRVLPALPPIPAPVSHSGPAIDVSNARPWQERTLSQCAWLLDDGRSCCGPVRDGSSYCTGHHRLIYRPTDGAQDLIRSLRKYA